MLKKPKHPLKTNRKASVSKTINANAHDSVTNYSFFYLALLSVLLIIDVLFQRGETNVLIARAWGMNNFAYFPWWVQAFTFTILFALAIPSVNNAIRLLLQKNIIKFNGKITGKLKKILWFTGISLCIALLFYLFRVKYDLLGDMNLRVTQTVQSKYIPDEYFTMYLLHQLHFLLQKLFHFAPHDTFVFHSVAAGFFYSLLGLLIADLLFDNLHSFIVFFLFYISIGTLLVFCGYVEIYAIPAASVSLYIYTSLLFLKKKINILLPLFCVLLAVALHLEQMSLLPSFVFLAVIRTKLSKFVGTRSILLVFFISIPLIYLLNTPLDIASLTPLTKMKAFPEAYTVFSFTHFWEFFNAEYISSGVYLFLFTFIVVAIFRKKIKEDNYSLFFLTVTLFSISIVFTANKERGSGDWDICSFPAISLAIFVAYNILTYWNTIYSKKKVFYITSIALLLNTFSTWAWIGINTGQKSLDKIENMLDTDPGYYYKTRLPSEIELSILFGLYGTHQKAIQYYKSSFEKYGDRIPCASTNYIAILMHDKDTNDVVPVVERTIAIHPFFYNAYDLLFSIYEKRKQPDKVYNQAKIFIKIYNANTKTVLQDPQGKNFLTHCVSYLYNVSIKKNDTATTRDMILKMQQLHMNIKHT